MTSKRIRGPIEADGSYIILKSGAATQVTMQAGSNVAAAVFTLPPATATLATLALAETLTNKTIAAGSNFITGLANANMDNAAAIAYSKLALTDSLVNADINSAAAIAYSKLSLTGSLVNADVSASAAIALSKLAALSNSIVPVTNGSGVLTSSSVTTTELGYLSGVTSALQTQIDAKSPTSNPTFTGTVTGTFSGNLTGDVTGNVSGTAGNVTGTVAIANGGTGQTSANAALNALLPTQTGNAGKILSTDGTDTAWAAALTSTLTDGFIFVGDAANQAAAVAVSGDITLSNTGVAAIAPGVIVNDDINASAAIVDTKLSTISTAGKVSNSATTATALDTASAIVARDADKRFAVSGVDHTPLGTAPAYAEGRMWYDSVDDTMRYYNDSATDSVNIGQELNVKVRNTSGSTITAGQVVRVTGATGNIPNVSLAQANSFANSRVYAVVTETIADNATGYATIAGLIKNLNLSAFNEGDVVYLSSTVAGGLTATRPSAPNYAMVIGAVASNNGSQGRLIVKLSVFRALGLGSANQIMGMNSGGTENEYKTLAVGTSGTDFAIAHSANTVTFNIPDASASARGLVTTGTQTIAGAKTFTGITAIGPTGGGSASAGTAHTIRADAVSTLLVNNTSSGGTAVAINMQNGATVQSRWSASSSTPFAVSDAGISNTLFSVLASGATTTGITTTTAGHISQGAPTSSGVLRVLSGVASAGPNARVLDLNYTTDTDCTGGYFLACINQAGAIIGRIEAASNTTTSFVGSSDRRLKTNFQEFSGLELVNQMSPKKYEWVSNPGKEAHGFVAQDLYEVYPEAVSVGGDDVTEEGGLKNPWGVDYGKLTPVLVKAIQEQQALISALQARIEALEATPT